VKIEVADCEPMLLLMLHNQVWIGARRSMIVEFSVSIRRKIV